MNSFSCIEVSLVVEGKYFDVEQFTEEIEIVPTETRGIDDWPQTIKNNLDIPQELHPRYVWCICQKAELCKQVKTPIQGIMTQLKGREQKLVELCKKNSLQIGLNITVHGEAMNLPELVLSPAIVSYFGYLEAEIGFDIYVY